MNNAKGLCDKYIVTKSDGTPVSGRCFILEPDKDPVAVKALQTYASATDNELLRNDLFAWVGKPMQIANDLISREVVLEALRARGRELLKLGTSFEANIASVTALECVNVVKDAPAVDAAPVVHGRWIDNGIPESMLSGCSVCGFPCGAYTFNFCPNCGARMNKEEK